MRMLIVMAWPCFWTAVIAGRSCFAADHETHAQRTPLAVKSTKPSDNKNAVQRFMRAKLKVSQKVLEGLVTENFKRVEDGAEEMLVMSKAAFWQVRRGPVYAQYSAEFQRTTEQLVKNAREKKGDAATWNDMRLTMNCVACHRYVKKTKVANCDVPQRLPVSDLGRLSLSESECAVVMSAHRRRLTIPATSALACVSHSRVCGTRQVTLWCVPQAHPSKNCVCIQGSLTAVHNTLPRQGLLRTSYKSMCDAG